MKKVTFDSEAKVDCIESEAFKNCTALEEITLPKKVTEIGRSAFKGCSSLTTANLAISEQLSGNVFENCTNLKSVHLSKKTRYVGNAVFKGCKSLETVTIKGEVKTLYTNVFNNCTALKKIYIKKGTVSDINKKAFKGAKSGIKFYVNTKKQAKTLKGALEKTNIKSAKIYANNVLVYKNVG